MTAKEILASSRNVVFETEEGESHRIELRAGPSAAELAAFEQRFPRPLPQDIRELLSFARGCGGAGRLLSKD